MYQVWCLAHAEFLLERRHTTERPTHAGGYASVGNKLVL